MPPERSAAVYRSVPPRQISALHGSDVPADPVAVALCAVGQGGTCACSGLCVVENPSVKTGAIVVRKTNYGKSQSGGFPVVPIL